MDPIQQLAVRRIELIRALDEIKTQIKETDDELIDRVTHHAEGSHTVHAGNFKITTTASMRRTVDPDAWQEIRDDVPPELHKVIRAKLALDVKLYKQLEQMRPEVFAVLAECVTTKPGSIAVKVSEVEL
tara:strand:+ start:139 stop:525 length:387 start_codon:yes stop_codon:yes gene_type:complete